MRHEQRLGVMKIQARKLLSILLLFIWLWQLVPSVMALSNVEQTAEGFGEFAEENEEILSIDKARAQEDARRDLLTKVGSHLALSAAGVVAGLLVFFSATFWRTAVILTSALYLLFWHLTGATSRVSISDAYAIKWRTSVAFDKVGDFFVLDVLAPVVFVTILLAFAISLIRRRKR